MSATEIAYACAHCHEPLFNNEEPAEVDGELMHFGCYAHLDALKDLRDKLAQIAGDLADVLDEYRWERQRGSSKTAPQSSEEHLLTLRALTALAALKNSDDITKNGRM